MIFTTGAQQVHSPSASDLQTLRMKFQDEPWTGMAEAGFPSGERIVFLFSGGMIKCSYRTNNNITQKRDAELEWGSLLRSLPSNLTFNTLGVSALRLARIVLEHPVPAETLLVQDGRLDHVLDQWHQQSHPNLAVLTWFDRQEIVMLWPGKTVPPATVLLSARGASEESGNAGAILSPRMGECDAVRHEFVSDGGAWEEYGFQFISVRLLGALLARYKELTGLALLNALDRNINRIAFENRWDFSITLGVITDRMFFCNLDETIEVCKTLLQVACDHIAVVLGQKLSRSMVQDVIAALDVHSMRVIEKYSIDAFLGLPRNVLTSEERANV